MAQVTVEVNGRPYAVGCEDGQEARLLELARIFDRQVRDVSQDMGHMVSHWMVVGGAVAMAISIYAWPTSPLEPEHH